MRSSYIFWIDRGMLFGRIVFNKNANNNAYRAVPQDTHDLGCPEGVQGFSRILVRKSHRPDRFQRRVCFKFFHCFSFVSSMGCLPLLILYSLTW